MVYWHSVVFGIPLARQPPSLVGRVPDGKLAGSLRMLPMWFAPTHTTGRSSLTVQSYRARTLNSNNGENAGVVPNTPYGLVNGRPLTWVMHWPAGVGFFGVAGVTPAELRQGEFVCSE